MTGAVLAGIPNPVEVVTDAASNVARATTGTLFDGLGSFLVSWVADGCRDIGREVVAALSGPAQVDFAHGWWAGPRGRALAGDIGVLAIALTLVFVFLALLQGVLAGDPGGMLRTVLTQLPLSVLGMVTVVGATELLLGVTDEATHLVLGDAPANLGRFVDGLTATAAVPGGSLALAFLLVVFLLGAFLVWVELAVRSALVFLLVAFAPLVLAARIWPGARGIFRRLVELGIAVIVSKFVIAVALALGSAALAGGGPTQGASAVPLTMASLLGGATLMGLAAFTPFVVLRLLPVVETAVVAHGIASSPVRGAQAAAAAGALPGRVTRMVVSGHPPTSAAGPAALAAGPMRMAGPSTHTAARSPGTRATTSATSADHIRTPQRLDGTSKTASAPAADRRPSASAPDRRLELRTRPDQGSGDRPPKGVDQ